MGSDREGKQEPFSLGSYLLLVDYTSRLCRSGKARVDKEVASILERIGSSAEIWSLRMKKLFATGARLAGSYFASDRERLRQVAMARGVHHLDNLAGYPAT